mgnify:CR=1 FL=1
MSDDDAIINALLETLSEDIKRKPIIPSSEPSIETIEKLDDAEIIKEYDNLFKINLKSLFFLSSIFAKKIMQKKQKLKIS